MNNQKLEQADFKILNILLIKSNFHRIAEVKFGQEFAKENNINVTVNCNVINNQVVVTEILNFEILYDKNLEVKIEVEMVGVFERIKENQISLEKFGEVNGASIIFPFIRDHVSNLTLKAGLGQILLPLINFKSSSDSKIDLDEKVSKK